MKTARGDFPAGRLLGVKTRLSADQRRNQLLEAALGLAERRGFPAVTIRAIAEEAGVSLGVVHYCFEDKETLLAAMISRVVEEIAESVGGIDEAGAADHGGGGPAALRALVGAVVEPLWGTLEATSRRQLLTYEMTTYSIRHYAGGADNPARGQYIEYDRVLGGVVDELLARTNTMLRVEPTPVIRRMMSAIDGVVLRWLVDGDSAAARSDLVALLCGILTDEVVGGSAPTATEVPR